MLPFLEPLWLCYGSKMESRDAPFSVLQQWTKYITQDSDWGSVLERARWNFTVRLTRCDITQVVCVSACVRVNKSQMEIVFLARRLECLFQLARTPKNTVAVCVWQSWRSVPAAVLHNWLSTTCSVIAALPQLALATPFLLLKSCQVERMWCTASLPPCICEKFAVTALLFRLVG